MLSFWKVTFTIAETLAFGGLTPSETVVLPRNTNTLIVQRHVPAISEGSTVTNNQSPLQKPIGVGVLGLTNHK